MTTIRTRVLALITALAATLALAPVSGAPGAASADLQRQVVVGASGAVSAVTDAVAAVGGTVVDRLDRFGMVVARVPASQVDELGRSGAVASVSDDVAFAPQTRPDLEEIGDPSYTAAATIGADPAVATGKGVGIAVVDTGIAARPALRDNVIASVDVSGEADATDGYGHGTFMAGAIVGDERDVAGIAPDAHLVSIKVADETGGTSLSAVLRGLSAAIDAREPFNVRVVLLALGRTPEGASDPLQAAVEQLWANGLVVVVPAGNAGEPGVSGTLTTPGASPYVVTVGALDDEGTADRSDDGVPAWTGQGPAKSGRTAPDLVAPGVSVVSIRTPGSVIDRENPQGRVEGRMFRGSGTSIAAAVTAGAAALVLEKHPDLDPVDVKGRLLASAAAAPEGSDPATVGAGSLDVARAIAEDAEAANDGLDPVEPEDRTASNESYPYWLGHHWTAGGNWTGVAWEGHHWTGAVWDGHHWTEATWDGHHWTGVAWEGHHWTGHHWTGVAWEGHHWTGHHWTGVAWEGHHWTGHHWTGESWAGSHWL